MNVDCPLLLQGCVILPSKASNVKLEKWNHTEEAFSCAVLDILLYLNGEFSVFFDRYIWSCFD